MKSFLSRIASILLLFNGISALYGGWNLMVYPDGSSLELSTEWLQKSPFNNYFIPGLILFLFNGVSSIGIYASIIAKPRKYLWLVMVQGAILFSWIVIQIILIQQLHPLQFIFGAVGFALILLGRQLMLKTQDL
ncbi:hypothetical protein [Emticicia sp. 17c]|uniref:hypothetical protein n=1 Tax=Emticicia sp. 17c TaxID=3127704 RepID=UPI00301E4B83